MTDDSACLVEIKEGQREKRRVIARTREDATDWVESELDDDPTVEDYTPVSYRKLVYEDPDGEVLAFVEEIQTLEAYRADDPVENIRADREVYA